MRVLNPYIFGRPLYEQCVSCYPFENGNTGPATPASVVDETGNHDGTFSGTGTTTFASDTKAGGNWIWKAFAGAALEARFTIPNHADFNFGSGAYTISIWCNHHESYYGSAQLPYFLCKQHLLTPNANNEFGLYYNRATDKFVWTKGNQDGTGFVTEIIDIVNVRGSQLKHIVYSYDPADGSPYGKIYYNGVLAPTIQSYTGTAFTGMPAGIRDIIFGGFYNNPNNNKSRGIFDQTAFWKGRALSPYEVFWLYKQSNGRAYQYW